MREEGGKAKEKWVAEKNEKEKKDRGKIRYIGKHGRRRKTYNRSKNMKESNTRYEKRKIGLVEEGGKEERIERLWKWAEKAGKSNTMYRQTATPFLFHDPIALPRLEGKKESSVELSPNKWMIHKSSPIRPDATPRRWETSFQSISLPITPVSLQATNREIGRRKDHEEEINA